MKDTPSLFTDLYELTMAQIYFRKKMAEIACFEVTVRRLPEHWGFFVMAGLAEVESYLREFRFSQADIVYLRSTQQFSDDFLRYLTGLKPNVKIRALPEGTVFFPHEPILEVAGPLIDAQLLESYILNILGFSIISATLAARTSIAARGAVVVDFGLRRCQGPVAALRSARGAQMAGFRATSNVFAAATLGFAPSGTMAHSFVHVHESQEQAFRNFAEAYGENSILLVDTYDSIEGIKQAANLAKQLYEDQHIRILGIRIDSGDLAGLARFARRHFDERGVPFLKIFVSGDLDEFKIDDLFRKGAPLDGFGIGTCFAVSRFAPAIEIVYKIVQYGARAVFKTSPGKQTRPGRKAITRDRTRSDKSDRYERDIVQPLQAQTDDLLKPFEAAEEMPTIQRRLAGELSLLDDSVKAIRNPGTYPVEFRPG
ncbi:MAG: nicotinate phosphoribosyltransferase [Planctomycetes bacterium RBG_16_55_9]|nr:MAG: nicotinate phosphoribosyltransferase [Planctomycetes bacterium RBG_16_55_9]